MDRTNILGDVPSGLRDELFKTLDIIVKNFREERWEPSELNGGKLCEVAYTIIVGRAAGKYPTRASKPRNMLESCRALENETSLPQSLRLQVPRVLVALYDIRNHRGVGHVGSEVSPNHMDAVAVLYMAKWVVAELVRVFHNLDTATATAIVDSLVDREVPVVWRIGSKRRVLARDLTLKDQMLLLLYAEPEPVPEGSLLGWLEKSKLASTFRRDVLRPAHKARLVEYDEEAKTIQLSPIGIQHVETSLKLAIGL